MQRPQPPPTDPNHVLHVAEQARAFLKPLLGTDVSIASVERATGFAWCPVQLPCGQTVDPFLAMRLQGMSNAAFEDFLKSLEALVVSMPDACVSMQSKSDSVAVCAELWTELREPLATWISKDDFAAHVHRVCDRVSSHYIGTARAQLIEQLAGMRTLGRVCCARESEAGGLALVQQTVQDEAFVRTVTAPCSILTSEMKQGRVPLDELSACLEFESLTTVRGPAALAPCLAAKQFGLMRWVQEHGTGASIALTASINRVRRLTDPALGPEAWSAVTVCHLSASPQHLATSSVPCIRVPAHQHVHSLDKLVILSTATKDGCVAPLRAVRVASVIKQLTDGDALRPRTFSAGTLLAVLARVVAEARSQGATYEAAMSLEATPPLPNGHIQVVEDGMHLGNGDEDSEDEDSGDEDEDVSEDADGDFDEVPGLPVSPLLHIQAAAASPSNGVLVRMPPQSGAAGVPAALLRESAVFAAFESLLREANGVGKDVVRVQFQDVSNRAAVHGASLGQTTRSVAQNTSVVLRKFVPYLYAYVESMGQKLKDGDVHCLLDTSWRGPGRCVSTTGHGRDWALLCLAALQRRMQTDPKFPNEWHGNRKNKSKARRRALKATHAVATSTAAAALAE